MDYEHYTLFSKRIVALLGPSVEYVMYYKPGNKPVNLTLSLPRVLSSKLREK